MNSNQTQLDTVKQAFDEWRTNRPKMEKIPLYLWELSLEIKREIELCCTKKIKGTLLYYLLN